MNQVRVLSVAVVAVAALLGTPATLPAGDTPPVMPEVYRVQFVVQTSNHKGADTDSKVRVSLAPRVYTRLDLPGNDFERGTTKAYDLRQSDADGRLRIAKLSDIEHLEITKEGKEKDWAVVSFQLLVNGEAVYEERFKDRKWLGSHAVSRETLRESAGWRAWQPKKRPGLTFTGKELEERIGSVVGHMLEEKSANDEFSEYTVRWGDRGCGLRLSKLADDSLRVHLDLSLVMNNLPNPDFDLDFDIRCVQREDRFEVRIAAPVLTTDGPVAAIGTAIPRGRRELHDARARVRDGFSPRFVIADDVLSDLADAGAGAEVVDAVRELGKELNGPKKDGGATIFSRLDFDKRLAKVMSSDAFKRYGDRIARRTLRDPGLIFSIPVIKLELPNPLANVPGLEGLPVTKPLREEVKVYCHVHKNCDVEVLGGVDPMVAVREEQRRRSVERALREMDERQRRNMLEP